MAKPLMKENELETPLMKPSEQLSPAFRQENDNNNDLNQKPQTASEYNSAIPDDAQQEMQNQLDAKKKKDNEQQNKPSMTKDVIGQVDQDLGKMSADGAVLAMIEPTTATLVLGAMALKLAGPHMLKMTGHVLGQGLRSAATQYRQAAAANQNDGQKPEPTPTVQNEGPEETKDEKRDFENDQTADGQFSYSFSEPWSQNKDSLEGTKQESGSALQSLKTDGALSYSHQVNASFQQEMTADANSSQPKPNQPKPQAPKAGR